MDVGVVSHRLDDVPQLVPHPHVDGVEEIGTVEGDPGDAFLLLVEEGVEHRVSY